MTPRALAAWLSARARHERILLRIEDIDAPRAVPDADRWIMDDLAWLGLDWDGVPVYQSQRLDLYEEVFARLRDMPAGPLYPCFCSRAEIRAASAPQEGDRPVYQSQRLDLYEEVFARLRDMPAGPLYPCFCSRAEIRAASAPQEGDRFIVYPGACRRLGRSDPDGVARRLTDGARHSWRFAVPPAGAPDGLVSFTDRVYGPRRFDLGADLGDVVMRRSDGLFAYQFVVTVDDLLMGVDDIVRGRDLLRSTALQEHVRALLLDMGLADRNRPATRPAYAHLPLLDDAAGVRLAKREHAPDLGALRAQGVRPEQIIGYCAWALGLTDHPQAMEAADALALFSWDAVRDLGALRAQGVRPEQIIGYCAWALGLTDHPQAMEAADALALFSWDAVRAHVDATDARSDADGTGGRVGDDDRSDGRADVRVPDDLPSLLLRL